MKTSKNILAVLLSLLMAFSLCVVGFAAEEQEQDKPLIYIPGFTSSNVYDDVNNPDTLVQFPTTEDILSIVTEAFIPAMIVFAADRNIDKLVKSVTDRVNDCFAYWFNEPTGQAKEGSGIIPEVLTDVTTSSELTFSYDWRSDPMVIADELNSYIEQVCTLSGSDKVALGCHSLGSTIALAYLTKYGNDRVAAIVFDSPACNGVSLVGNIFTGNIHLDAEGSAYFLKALMGDSEYNELVSSVIDVLSKAHVLELFTDFADEIIDALAPAVYRETIVPLLGCWPTMWSMVPDGQIEAAMAYMFDEILTENDFSVLKNKLNTYNNAVRVNRENTLKSFDAVGNFAVLSRYTSKTVPLDGYAHLISDQLIETSASSLGATTADIGECFSEEYLKDKNPLYISPDKTVDASTCLFPEKTWFIKDSGHFETGELTVKYYNMFLFAKEELTCETASISRFTLCDKSNYTLVEDISSPTDKKNSSYAEILYNFITSLIKTVKTLIEKFF